MYRGRGLWPRSFHLGGVLLRRLRLLVAPLVLLGGVVYMVLSGFMVADAAPLWLYDLGIAEGSLTPTDIFDGGLGSVAAVAVGLGASALGVKLTDPSALGTLRQDAWSWAQNNGSSFSTSLMQDWSYTAGGVVILNSALKSALTTFYQNEVQKLGWFTPDAGMISQPSNGGDTIAVGSITSDVSTQINWFDSTYSAQEPFAYKAVAWYVTSSGYTDAEIVGSQSKFTLGINSSGGLEVFAGASTVYDYYGGLSAGSSTLQGKTTTIAANTSGGNISNPTLSAAALAGFGNSVASYPASPEVQAGGEMYLPPLGKTSAGNAALGSPTLLKNGDLGMTNDGTTGTDVATGTSQAVAASSTSTTATNTAGILSALQNFFDLSKPIDWSPIRNLPVSKKFPFSLPWDLKAGINSLVGTGAAPSWSFSWQMPQFVGGQTLSLDFSFPSSFDSLVTLGKDGEIVAFNIGLIWGLRKLMGGDV